ncbi:AGAP007510-PA-like protein [Anopheles sinensis]|uniref:AGAP007510-PA-like protein n=1 Tax=Anopheles sinensis TaxID=74873 RepID=A0A084WND3_ANOSI|nr:AGAP007510-PA-like protein [Anopheles sinensis]
MELDQEKGAVQNIPSLAETDEKSDLLSSKETSADEPVENRDEKKDTETDKNNGDDDEEKLLEKIETLKGDRIGETMYSERFVLSTILKLSQRTDKLLEEEEEFERDLCNLWDMTIEPDVVRFLLQQEVIELFLALATNSTDYRLIEILFGIIGNMCCVSEMHDYVYHHSELLLNLCDFLTLPDAPVLVQLMRTLTTLFDRSDDEQYRWFDVMRKVDNLVEKLAVVLATSTNRALLEHTVETINAMINRFTEAEMDYAQLKEFYCIFAKSCLPEGLFEAFQQLYPAKGIDATGSNTNGFDEDPLTLKDLKTMRRFLEVHEHFIVNANELYESHVEEVVQCVYRVLVSFVGESMLFPLTKNHVGMFVSINNIYSGIMYHFHCESFVCMVRIYEMLWKAMSNNETTMEHDQDEPDGGEEEFDAETACAELLEVIFYLVGPIDEQIIRGAVQGSNLNAATIDQLCRGMREAMDGDPLLYQTCTKLMNTVTLTENAPQPPHANGHEQTEQAPNAD